MLLTYSNRPGSLQREQRHHLRPLSAPSTCSTRSRHSIACRADLQTPGGGQNAAASRAALDAFYVGRAFAQTLSERLGSALGDALGDVAKRNAEAQRTLKDFQSEVEARAEADKRQAGMPPSPAAASSRAPRKIKGAVFGSEEQAAEEPERSLQETVDELRAEVAATRAAVQQLKLVEAERSPKA